MRIVNKIIWNSVLATGIAIALVVMGSSDLAAQRKAVNSKPVKVTVSHQSDIIDSLTEALNAVYVFPDVAIAMEEKLRENLKAGKYDTLLTLPEFMQAIQVEIREISHDLHLGVNELAPSDFAAIFDEEDPEEQKKYQKSQIAARRRSNYGFNSLKILDGNVGYLDLREFNHASVAGLTAVAAMNFLSSSDAIIFDLRKNRGGSPSMVQLITSFFLDDATHLNSFYIRKTDTIRQFWTSSHVQGPKMSETPIYVLTSSNTASAAEEFTYNLKHLKRATIVGEITRGGAHPIETHYFQISDEVFFRMSLPYGRAINPITGTNWEGTGVIPDMEVPANQALDVALVDAYKNMSESSEDEGQIAGLQWAIGGIEVKMNPVALDEKSASSYVGIFGPRVITFEDGDLYYQRTGRAKFRMIPMGDDLFAIDGLDFFRIQFVRDSDGSVNKLIGTYDDGDRDSNTRSK